MQQSARARYGTSTDAAITTLKLIIGPGDEVEPDVNILPDED